MAKRKVTRKSTRKSRPARKSRPVRKAARASRSKTAVSRASDPLLEELGGEADSRTVGHVRMDVVRAGEARVKRVIYPAGFRWSTDMKPVTGTSHCMHAHVGFLARGRIHIEYADGCRVEFKAPQVVVIDPGHDGWVVGKEPVVLIEFDFERDTIRRLGVPDAHHH